MPNHIISGRGKKDSKDTATSTREILQELQKINDTLCKILNHQRYITRIEIDKGDEY